MPMMTIDLRQELNECRLWLQRKTDAAATSFAGQALTVGQIKCLYNFDQRGWIGMDFDTADPISGADDLSKAEWKNLLWRPDWTPFYEAEGEAKRFIRTDGSMVTHAQHPELEDFISVELSTMLVKLFTTAWSSGVLKTVPFRPGWRLSIGDFNGWWSWGFEEAGGRLVQTWPGLK